MVRIDFGTEHSWTAILFGFVSLVPSILAGKGVTRNVLMKIVTFKSTIWMLIAFAAVGAIFFAALLDFVFTMQNYSYEYIEYYAPDVPRLTDPFIILIAGFVLVLAGIGIIYITGLVVAEARKRCR